MKNERTSKREIAGRILADIDDKPLKPLYELIRRAELKALGARAGRVHDKLAKRKSQKRAKR